jgi:hypothetical protein
MVVRIYEQRANLLEIQFSGPGRVPENHIIRKIAQTHACYQRS